MVAAWARFHDDVRGYHKVFDRFQRSAIQVNEDGPNSLYVMSLSTAIVALVNGDENAHALFVLLQQIFPLLAQASFIVAGDP
jgi:hypothetical protein